MRGFARTPLSLLLVVLSTLAAGGCDTREEPVDLTESSGDMTVGELGRVGARVYLAPEHAEEIVAEAGLTPAEFEDRIRNVTNNPGLSLTYARAFETEVAAARAQGAEASGTDPGTETETSSSGT